MESIFSGKNIVLGVTGAVAAYKSVYLLRLLVKSGANVQVIGTENSLNFVGKATWESLSGKTPLFDTFETKDPAHIGHIMLAQDVDAIIVAPATANIIAKTACGLADDLLSTVLCAATVPVLFAPGMNTAMYDNPANKKNMDTVSKRPGFYFIDAGTGELACRTSGKGRMAEPEEIFNRLSEIMSLSVKNGIKWLVTGGATREYIDPVRFITNGSSGKTGLSIALEAFRSGGDVTFIGINVEKPLNCGFRFIKTVSAAETAEKVKELVKDTDIFVMSAAVADFSPVKSPSKIKKGEGSITLQLNRTEDILKSTSDLMKKGSVRIGFAAETENLEENSMKKMNEKKLDFIIANLVSKEHDPFGSDSNSVLIIEKTGIGKLENIDKKAIAKIITDKASKLFMEKNEK